MASRRDQIRMTPEEIRAFLDSKKTLIIVSNGRDGFPHPMPMWFYADPSGAIWCTTFRKSQKVLNLRRDPRATLLVESGEVYAELKSVVFYAQAEVIDDRAAVIDTLVNINTRGRTVAEGDLPALIGAVSQAAGKRVALKFTPEREISWDHAKLGGRY
jgi:nitroimidazol reductase NimA-like FMN-containing flavoprotein (pyridoxamine 5'-phosphate oxidase superfamily)